MKAKSLKIRRGVRLMVHGEFFQVTDVTWDGVEGFGLNGKDRILTDEEIKNAYLV